jgi:phospholipid/cholesterol/gamma-HCH transport system substrate-binding protein
MDAPPPPAPSHLEAKAVALLLGLLLLLAGTVLYVLYARGLFERTQELVLIAEDSEGVVVGMDLTFSGFPIGRVRRTSLAEDGSVRIVVDVPVADAGWLRTSSVFVLVRGLVGNTSLRAYSGVMSDPPLPPGAERRVLRGDATDEIPRLVTEARGLIRNLTALTATDSALAGTLAHVEATTKQLADAGGLAVMLGGAAPAQRLTGQVERSLQRTDALLARLDALAANADRQVFGSDGLVRDMQATVAELRGLLEGTQASLQRVDALLDQAHAIAGDVRGATADLDQLRSEVDASLRRVDHLIGEINRRWPLGRDTELKLP